MGFIDQSQMDLESSYQQTTLLDDKWSRSNVGSCRRTKLIVGVMVTVMIIISMIVAGTILIIMERQLEDDSNVEPWVKSYDLDNTKIYYNNSCVDVVETTEKIERTIYSLYCPPFKYGAWQKHQFCNIGRTCIHQKVYLEANGSGQINFQLCYPKCNYDRHCDYVTGTSRYTMPKEFCSAVNIRCQSLAIPLGNSATIRF